MRLRDLFKRKRPPEPPQRPQHEVDAEEMRQDTMKSGIEKRDREAEERQRQQEKGRYIDP